MAGKLYIVPTPVGNLEDMTFRAVEVLKQVDLILAEDTRTTSVLLKHYGISRPTEAHHKFNEHARVRPVCEKILSGMDIALVSDAGTPGISDPGFMLARECAEEGIEVITLPGATAFVPALVDSGLPLDRFAFEGFLPVKKGRQTRLSQLASEGRTMVFYESPYRLAKTLTQMCEYFGAERKASVSREISKIHEETRRGTLQELASWYTDNPNDCNEYDLWDAADLAGLAYLVNNCKDYFVDFETGSLKIVRLRAAVDMSAHYWEPIGTFMTAVDDEGTIQDTAST